MDCISCEAGVDHCHGTLIVHTDFVIECIEVDCVDTDVGRHSLVVDCRDLAGGCGCARSMVRAEAR